MKFGQRFSIFTLALLLSGVAWPAYSLEFPRTSDRGAPSRTAGAGTRGDTCLDPSQEPTLTALLPNNSLATTYAADSEIPSSLFFYVPDNDIAEASLTVVDVNGEAVYEKTLSLPDAAGVMQVMLPQSDDEGNPMFEAGELYFWDFAVICDAESPEDNILVGGGIQRADVDAEVQAALETAGDDLLAQAEVYAAAGAWQEALALAAELVPADPEPWKALLTSVGLEAIADAPIVFSTDSSTDQSATHGESSCDE